MDILFDVCHFNAKSPKSVVKMFKNGMNLGLCRLCGFKNENGQSLSDEDNAELLAKIQTTISPLVCKDDPLPKRVCIQCQQDVHVFHNKIKRFRMLESKWCDILKKETPNHPYLELIDLYDNNKTNFQEKIDACDEQLKIEKEKNLDPLAENPNAEDEESMKKKEHTKTSTEPNDTEEIAKTLEKERNRIKKRRQNQFSGYVRSRALRNKHKKQIKVKTESNVELRPQAHSNDPKSESSSMPNETDKLNRHTDLSYKKYRNPILEIISKNEILNSRTRTNRRTSKPFVYDFHAVKAEGNSTKKVAPATETTNTSNSKTVKEKLKASLLLRESSSSESPSRKRRRINYSEDLVDEAFMYEQMLENKQHEEKCQSPKWPGPASKKKTKQPDVNVGNIDSRLRLLEQRNEISIMPVKSRLVSKMDTAEPNVSVPLKPEPLFNITSSVSVHIKPRNSIASTSEPTVPILHIRRGQNGYEATASKKGRVTCNKCNHKCADLKALAVHQLVHLSIATHRIDSKKVLHPRLRRGRMLKIDNDNFIRCVNCAKLHPNNKSILDHWNNGECIFYCWLCGKSFHNEKVKELDLHFQTEHGMKRCDPLEIKRVEAKVNKTKEQPNVENACKLCSRTFCNRQALSIHLTMTHERKLSLSKEMPTNNQEQKKIGSRKTVNPMALANKIAPTTATSSVKNVKKQMNKVMYNSVALNAPKKVSQPAKPTKKKKPKKSKSIQVLGKLPAQVMSNLNVTLKRVRQLPETPPKNNQDVSSTTDHPYSSQIIKSEPIDDCSAIDGNVNPALEISMPTTYENWDQRVDSSIDTSPRLKVKNLTDLQAPSQLFSLDTHSFVQTQPPRDQLIMSNGNVSGLQIQNVQSYHMQAMSPQQPFANTNYSCINGIDTNLNLSGGIQLPSMCPPNFYEIQHIPQASPVQNTQLINPVYLLQQSSSHGPY